MVDGSVLFEGQLKDGELLGIVSDIGLDKSYGACGGCWRCNRIHPFHVFRARRIEFVRQLRALFVPIAEVYMGAMGCERFNDGLSDPVRSACWFSVLVFERTAGVQKVVTSNNNDASLRIFGNQVRVNVHRRHDWCEFN